MTIPFERTRALNECKQRLTVLADRARVPRDPAELQCIAMWVNRHYPTLLGIEAAHQGQP